MNSSNSNRISFKGKHFYVGIDVHKKRWVVTIRHNGMELKTFSMDPDIEALKSYLEKNYPEGIYHLVYEAGFSGFWICRGFRKLGMDCIVVNPADVPTSHKEKDRKRDVVDSRKLARELEKGELSGIYIPDEEDQHLRSLCRLHRRIVQNTTRVKNRIKGHLYYNGIELPRHTSSWSAGFIAYLKELPLDNGPAKDYLDLCIEELEQDRQRLVIVLRKLRTYVRNHSTGDGIRLLMTIPGIGFRSALVLFTEFMDMKRFSNIDKLKSYVGLVPSTHSSGEKESTSGITRRRNGYLRHILIESAWVAVRKDPALLAYYNTQSSRMKKQDAIVRVATKLLSRIRCVWLNDRPYVTGVA